jgi:hypothetical protein
MRAPRTETGPQRPGLVNWVVQEIDVALLAARPFLGLVLLRLLDFLAALILASHCVLPSAFVRIVTRARAAVEGPYGAAASAQGSYTVVPTGCTADHRWCSADAHDGSTACAVRSGWRYLHPYPDASNHRDAYRLQ